MKVSEIRVFIAALIGLAGCAPQQTAQPAAVSAAPSTVSWDGTYRGTVQVTGLGSGIQKQWCDTDPLSVVQVSGDAFRYAMPHPNAPDNPTPVYRGRVAPDGRFRSQLGSGTMIGQITGGHMAGTIDGSACVYSFSMDRM